MLSRSSILLSVLAVAGVSLFSNASRADEPIAKTFDFFEKEIRPVLADHCFKCHGEEKAKSGLRLDSRAAILKGGNMGPAAVPGKPNDSLLIQAIRRQGELRMPPKETLNPRQI